MQLLADQPIQHRPSNLHTTKKKDSKTFLFPTVELSQLTRNTDITKILRFLDINKMCPITDIHRHNSPYLVQNLYQETYLPESPLVL